MRIRRRNSCHFALTVVPHGVPTIAIATKESRLFSVASEKRTIYSWKKASGIMLSPTEKEQFTILIVDDEPKNIQLLANILQEEGYLFEFATNGEEALGWITSQPFHLILLDIMMPGMDGYEVCAQSKKDPQTSEIPIIFLSAKAEQESIVRGFEVGSVDYVTKPFNKKELLARIETHLELKRYRDRLEELVKEKTLELNARNLDLEKINKATEHFVPFEFLNILGKESVVDVQLGDQIYGQMTIMFSDIRSYTEVSETMTPQEVFDFTNGYHTRMTPLIRTHHGFVQQFQGDGVVSVFPDSPVSSVHAAVAIQKKLQQYNAERIQKKRTSIGVGIGLHSGSLMVGIIGDEKRWESGIPSDTVNTAARMEGLTKFYGCSIVISESTYKSLASPDQFDIRFLDKVCVKGKQKPLEIYEVMDSDHEDVRQLKMQTMEDFKAGLDYYFARDFETARSQFYKVLAINPNDQTVTLYLKRTMRFIEKGVPDDWDGVTVFEQK